MKQVPRPESGLSSRPRFPYALFAMFEPHFYAILLMQMQGQMLGGIHAAVLSAGATECKHQVGESTFHISLHMCVGQMVYTLQETKNLPVFFQETDYRFVQTGQRLILFVTSGIVCGATVEHISSTVPAFIFRYSLPIRETKHTHH